MNSKYTPAPKDRLGWLDQVTEEAAEVIKAIPKFKRFGPKATDPHTGKMYDNRDDLLTELEDLEAATEHLRSLL